MIALLLAAAPVFAASRPESRLPLFFFSTAPDDFLVQSPDLSARFRPDSATFRVHRQQFRVRFVGASRRTVLKGMEPLGAKVNLILGGPPYRTDLPTYSKIVYRGLYRGIDMTYGGTAAEHVKSEFIVWPGASTNSIQLEYSEPVTRDARGDLHIGDFMEEAPKIYQRVGVSRVRIEGHYRLIDAYRVGFEIGAYDKSLPLVIDPTISYCTYLGGSGLTSITGVAADASSNLYVTGWTEALNFPTAGAVEATNQGDVDVIVAKLNTAGTTLLYATYIGGSASDRGAAIAVDSLGEAYVTGSTSSSNFPRVLSNRTAIGGSTTVFALKLNAAGNTLLYSGYIGGTNYDAGTAIAVDANENAYIAGETQSANFPIQNPVQSAFAGGTDAFVTKLNSTGAITFSTYLGGSGNDAAGGIAVDSLGDIFVSGGTSSTNFPIVSAYQSALPGAQGAFLTKIGYAGAIAFSTYLGGSGGSPQQATAVALDSAGNPYVVGVTTSTNFPVTAGAFQTALAGSQSAFLTKMTSTGSGLVYSTYLGGSSYDWASGVVVNAAGNAYVAGYTSSLNFPQASAVQASFGGLYDGFVSEFNFAGNGLLFSTYYGGSGSDSINAIALDPSANIFVGGQTSSTNLNVVNDLQSSNNASSTGWVMRLGVTSVPATIPSVTSVTPTSGSGSSVTFTATYGDTGGGAAISAAALLVNASATVGYGCYVSYNPATNLFSIYADAGTSVLSTVAPGGSSAQNDQCALNGAGSSAAASGTTLTVTFSLTFQPSFPGATTVYLEAADTYSNTGWVAEGTYTVTIPTGQPSVNSVSPNSGSGTGTTFTAVYSDSVYAQNLTSVALLFNSNSVTFSSACDVIYNITAGTVALETDNGQGTTSMQLGASGTLQNSQCIVSTTSATTSGLSIIFTVAIVFKGVFTGTQNIYGYAAAGSLNTGWVVEGTYGAANGGNPVANSAVPGSGSGAGERFSFTISDKGGATYLNSGAIVFNTSLSFSNACYLVWDGNANTISLVYNNPANGQTEFTPGANGIATNSQCTMNAANSTIVTGATQVIITLDLTFNSTFFGTKNIYLYAAESNSNSGWATVGTWTVTGGASTANSVSPSSGSGSTQTFLFTVSDSSSQINLSGMTMLFTSGAPTNVSNACFLVFNRTAATIGLWDNSGTTTLSTKGIGSSATLQNSQCAVGYTVMYVSGNSIELSIQLVFYPANFGTAKSIYLEANEPSTNSGFVYLGAWTP